MLKKILPALPHAAILLANMIVALFIIDQINPSMNFIDNGLTKGVLLGACVLAIVNWHAEFARRQRLMARKKKPRGGLAARLPGVDAILCALGLLALMADWIFPAWSLFLKEPFKWFLLALSVATIIASGIIAHGNRRRLRRRLRRQKGRGIWSTA